MFISVYYIINNIVFTFNSIDDYIDIVNFDM